MQASHPSSIYFNETDIRIRFTHVHGAPLSSIPGLRWPWGNGSPVLSDPLIYPEESEIMNFLKLTINIKTPHKTLKRQKKTCGQVSDTHVLNPIWSSVCYFGSSGLYFLAMTSSTSLVSKLIYCSWLPYLYLSLFLSSRSQSLITSYANSCLEAPHENLLHLEWAPPCLMQSLLCNHPVIFLNCLTSQLLLITKSNRI